MNEAVEPWRMPAVVWRRQRRGDKTRRVGKPLETMGLQSYGTKVREIPRYVRRVARKPRETVGRKATI